jgi:hypothetical protein
MYYPYLRGRQFELIALREYSQIYQGTNKIVPIIEPVKKAFNSMKLALPLLIQGNVKFALILNPQVGEISKSLDITDELKEELADQSKWIPAYLLGNNFSEVSEQIFNDLYNEVMVICSDKTDTSSSHFDEFISSPYIKYIVSKENRTLKRKLAHKEKILIRLDDNFIAQKRNSDYSVIDEEKFSEEHMFYEEDGYAGFSDFTVLISDFIEGGAAPYAVAIHLTYQKENREVWVKHFVSTSNDDRANIQGKFAEAAEKAVLFLDMKDIHTKASDELREYYNNRAYPGLGMVKKISIKNHLELLNDILNNPI